MSVNAHPPVIVPADCFHYDGNQWHGAPEQYLAAALEVARLTPFILPSFGSLIDFEAVLDCVDGLLISGAKSNVGPHYYGAQETGAHAPFDPARDATSLPLIHAALERGLPVLAICRGIQELNVALGGTLSPAVHDIPGRDDHRAPENVGGDEKFAIRQSVYVAPNSCLADIIGAGERRVNSVHGQAIDELSPQLRVEATASDGTIEAVSLKNAKSFAIGLQWHPEYWAKTDMPSRQILEAFGDAVRKHRADR